MMSQIDVVFDGPPDHEASRFVEVESPPGTGISFGEWVERPDGYWVLRFACPTWQPIASLPNNDSIIIARTGDGRVMMWRADILHGAMSPGTPAHLRFPASQWMEIPE